MEEKRNLIDDIRTVLNFYESLPSNGLYHNPKHEWDDDPKYLYSRLERAVIAQAHGERATSGRYLIWSRDIRFLIKTAIEDLENKDVEIAKEELIRILNSLGAFEDIMAIFDGVEIPMYTDIPRIFDGYKKYKDK